VREDAMAEELDDISELESPKETAHKLPVGWLLLFWGLIVWGVYYLWAYTPALGGWSQAGDLEGGGASAGANVFATILFTALAILAAVSILFALSRRPKRG
jgi:hypothetical protein